MPSGLYTGAEAAALATEWRRMLSANAAAVSRSAICNWVKRGHLDVAGLDEHGRPLYAHGALARAERATRDRALRLVDVTTPLHDSAGSPRTAPPG